MTDVTFHTLGVPQPLVAVLAAEGKTTAFPIQVDTLPDTLAGRDVLGRGKTGSGKTLAFAIPMVARLGRSSRAASAAPARPLGLVLAPTRELATQIDAAIEPLAKALRPHHHHHLRRRLPEPPGHRAHGRRRHRRRLPRPPRGPDGSAATCASTPSRSPCSTRPTTWPTSASCPVSRGSSTRPRRRPAPALPRHARQRRGQARQALPAERGAPLRRRGELATSPR